MLGSFFYKLKLLFNALFYHAYFGLKNRLASQETRMRSKDDSKPVVMVNLTSFPARIKKVYLTIESILAQNFNAHYQVTLYLSLDEFPNKTLPNSLLRLQKRGLIVEFVEGNIRSYKKLYYALNCELQTPNNLPQVTADDDIFYPSHWLQTLYDAHQKQPDCVIYLRGRKITFSDNHVNLASKAGLYKNIKLYNDFPLTDNFDLSYLSIPTGVSGILYPANIFHEDVCRADLFMTLAPTADDLWYKIMTLLNNKQCYLANNKSIHFSPVLGSQSLSLRKVNLEDGLSGNDKQLNALIDFYKIDLKHYETDLKHYE